MAQEYNTVDAKGWFSHVCYNWRSSSDSSQYVKGIKVGQEIKWRAGFNIFKDGNSNALVSGQANKLFYYTVMENSAAFIGASLAIVAAASASLGF